MRYLRQRSFAAHASGSTSGLRCAARSGGGRYTEGCEVLAYLDSLYCDSMYCGRATTDDCVVALSDKEFGQLYGRPRRESETLDFLRRAALEGGDEESL